jgi:hypothetical protein
MAGLEVSTEVGEEPAFRGKGSASRGSSRCLLSVSTLSDGTVVKEIDGQLFRLSEQDGDPRQQPR